MSKELWNHLKKVMLLKYICINGLLVSLIYTQESVHNCSCVVIYKDEVSALSFTPCLMCLSLCRIFGCTESVFSLKDEIYEGVEPEKRTMSTLDMLGGSPVKKSIERPQVLTLTCTWSVAFSFKTLVVYTHKHKVGLPWPDDQVQPSLDVTSLHLIREPCLNFAWKQISQEMSICLVCKLIKLLKQYVSLYYPISHFITISRRCERLHSSLIHELETLKL